MQHFSQRTRCSGGGHPAEKATISAKYCTEIVLLHVLQNRAKEARTQSGSRLLLHHDNASAHTAATSVSFMEDAGVQLFPHPSPPILTRSRPMRLLVVSKSEEGHFYETIFTHLRPGASSSFRAEKYPSF